MTEWNLGNSSTTHRFEKHRDGKLDLLVEVEDFDGEKAEVRVYKTGRTSDSEKSESIEFDSLEDAVDYIRGRWDVDTDALPGTPTVRVKLEVLSLLADYAGSDAVYGHDVPAETRDAIQAAYEALDEPGLPLSFYDCPEDGAALDPIDDPELSEDESRLECPVCDEIYILDRDHGLLELA